MKDFERDYPDHTKAPWYEHGDEPQCNQSANPNFYEVMDAHVKRRGFLVGGLASIATGPRSALPIMPIRPVSPSIISVNLSMRVAVVGPAGPTTSSRTGSTGPT